MLPFLEHRRIRKAVAKENIVELSSDFLHIIQILEEENELSYREIQNLCLNLLEIKVRLEEMVARLDKLDRRV